MNYFVITTKDEVLKITKEEHDNLEGKSGVVYIPSLGEMLNLSFIYRMIPENKYLDYLKGKRSKATNGVLSDGQRVFRKFGQWYSVNNPEALISPTHYPEVARDEVMSIEEYRHREDLKALPVGKPFDSKEQFRIKNKSNG